MGKSCGNDKVSTLTLLKKGHFAENLTRYHTILNLYDPLFSGHIEFFQRSQLYIENESS